MVPCNYQDYHVPFCMMCLQACPAHTVGPSSARQPIQDWLIPPPSTTAYIACMLAAQTHRHMQSLLHELNMTCTAALWACTVSAKLVCDTAGDDCGTARAAGGRAVRNAGLGGRCNCPAPPAGATPLCSPGQAPPGPQAALPQPAAPAYSHFCHHQPHW